MSGLASILAGRVPAGLYQWHAAFPAEDVQHTVEHAGWQFAYVDGWTAQTKPEFLEAIGSTLDFPEHFGRNWDALVDCLREVAPSPDLGVVLLWDGWATLADGDVAAFTTALSVLEERSRRSDIGPFAVLLRGAGPDLPQVSSLD
jgi:RNAse (barnase) inhibitor barstar